jgi:hypothetical protein
LSLVLILASLGIVAGYQNCAPKSYSSGDANGASKITVTGVVTKFEVDGCKFLICPEGAANNGDCYNPVKMNSVYLIEGNVVKIEGSVDDELFTTCMAGKLLQVNSVELVSGSPSPVPTP